MALTDAQAKIINRNKKKKEEAKKKASTYSNTTVSSKNKLSTGSQLSPLDLMKKDAATKTTVKDKVTYAKQSGAVEKTNVQKSVQANQKKQEAKSQARSQLTLSESDLSLPSLSKKGILDAKLSWGEAYNAGDKEGMAKAHADAEKIRSRYGYSGGSSGSEKIEGPGLSEKDKVTLNQSGQQALLSALTLGDKERAEEVRKAKGFQATDFSQKKDGEGRTIFSQTKEEQEKAGDQFLAGLEAAGKGFAGSLLSLHETFNQAMRNYNRDRWGRNIQANANQTRDKALAEASRKVLEGIDTVDPNLPGQTLLRESKEAAAEALEGKTGLSALLTKAGISSAQMLPGIAVSFIPGVGPAVGATILGAQAAGSRMGELNEQSRDARLHSYMIGGDPRDYGEVTPGESFGRGLVSGAIEGIAERLLPIKNLLNIVKGNGGASLLVNVAKQAGMEATEESASYILNYAADRLAQDPNAQLSMKDLAEAAAVGAISGAGCGAGGTVVNTAINANRGRTQTTERTGQDILLEAAGIKAPETQQNEPGQTFEQPQQEAPVQAETPAQAQERGEANNDAAEEAFDPTNIPRDAINKRKNEPGGWGEYYQNTTEMLFDHLREVNPELSSVVDAEADSQSGPFPAINAVVAASQDVRQDKVTPAAAIRFLSDTFKNGGVAGLEALYSPNTGNLTPESLETMKKYEAMELGETTEDELRAEFEAMGAMSKGGAGQFASWQAQTPGENFHPINERSSARSAELHGRAQVEIPKRNLDGLLTSKTLSTIANAGVTPNEVVQGMLDRAANGGFSRIVYGDNSAIQFARSQIEESGYQAMRDKWVQDITDGKSSKDVTVMGELLFQQAANSGTPEGIADALEIATMYDEYCLRTSRAFQAMNIMNKLSPEGQLYVISRSAERMTEHALEDKVKRTDRRSREVNDEILDVAGKAREEALAEIADLERALRLETRRREDAENVLLQAANAFREEQTKEFGGWVSEIGKELASNLSGRYGKARETTQPISRIILSDLVKFAEEKALPKKLPAGRKKRTSAERIADYFNNREEYDRAWTEAQASIREKYKDNKNALAAFDEWLNASSAYSVSEDSPVVLRAISESIAAEEISKAQREMRSAFDLHALSEQVFSRINETVNATGEDAAQLQLAISNALYRQGQEVDTAKRIEADTRKAMREIGAKMRDIIKQGAETKQEVANKIATMLVSEYGISPGGAKALSDDVVTAFNNRVAEASEKELANRFKDRPKRMQKTADEKLRELANLGAFSSAQYNSRATETLYGIPNVTISPELAQNFLNAKTEYEVIQAKQAIYKHIGQQMPSNWQDKFNAWRYTSMLGNFRTFGKNALGNIPTIPMRLAKDAVGTGLQKILGAEEKTKAIVNPFNSEDRARRAIAKDDFKNVESYIMSGGATNEGFSAIKEYQTVFSGILKPMEYYRKGTNYVMEKGDVIFSKLGYADALASYLKANKITAEQYANMTPDKKGRAREYAINYAQKVVFRDLNDFSKLVSSLGKLQRSDNKAARVASVLVEGVLPFKKTPANIAARAVEYSPVGLGVGIKKAVSDVRSGRKTSAEAIEWLSSGLVGTGIVGLGFVLSSLGFVTGGGTGDDKQDEFNELQGHQNYALEIGDTSVTIDWLAPASLPFFVGVELQKFAKRVVAGDWDSNQSILKSVIGIAEPMLEMTMLQSLEDVLEDVGYAENRTVAFLASSVVSYLTQYLPTLFGQIERVTEENRQMTFVYRDSWVPTEVQRALGKSFNKLPGEYAQVEYVDEWGRTEDKGNMLVRALNNLLNPFYTSKIQTGSAEAELQRLYDLGYEDVLPTSFQTSAKINGKYVTADQWLAMQTTRGKTAKAVLDSFIGTEQYNAMTDDERAKFVKKVLEYGSNMGKVKGGADADETFARWQEAAKIAKAEVGLSEAEIIAASAYQSVLGEDAGDETKASIKQGMYEQWVNDRTDLNDEQKAYLKNNIKFYQMIPADASSYNKAVEAGYTTPESIEALLSGKKEYDFDGNASYTNTEMYAYISSLPEGEQEMAWNALRSKGTTKSWATLKSEEAPKLAKQQKAQETLNGSMEADRQTVFANAISEYGTGSRYAVYQALMSIDATDSERQTYYNYVNAKKGWKASWAQMKANGGYP